MTGFLKWLAKWLRRAADFLDNQHPTEADKLFPRALELVKAIDSTVQAGSIKQLIVMKTLENETGAKRLDINEAIEHAVRLMKHGD